MQLNKPHTSRPPASTSAITAATTAPRRRPAPQPTALLSVMPTTRQIQKHDTDRHHEPRK